jgi:hypothetical protein
MSGAPDSVEGVDAERVDVFEDGRHQAGEPVVGGPTGECIEAELDVDVSQTRSPWGVSEKDNFRT